MRPIHLALSGLVFLALPGRPLRADPSALWHIVHDRCVPNQQRFATPLPCLVVDLQTGYVVMKDRVGIAQLLLLPTARVTGIEDPAIFAPEAPNYFQLAWSAANLVRALAEADLPDNALSLAINSIKGRTQNQLHIHIDCLRPDIRDALLAHAGEITRAWAPFPVPLDGHHYLARSVETLNRPGENPFQLLAKDVPGARTHMGLMTLLAAPLVFSGGESGFVLLADQADPPRNFGSAEELQDHRCALARAH